MTIPVVCPHCDSQFQLQSDLAGKAMRCPNADCREIFTVQATGGLQPEPPTAPALTMPMRPLPSAEPLVPMLEGEAVPLPTPVALQNPTLQTEPQTLPYQRVESEDIVPILEGEPSPATQVAPRKWAPPTLPTAEVVAEIVDEPTAEIFPQESKKQKRVRERSWKKAPPLPPVQEPIEDDPQPEPKRIRPVEPSYLDNALMPNRRGPGAWKYVLGGMILAIVAFGSYAGIKYLVALAREEENMALEANEEFKKQNYLPAVKLYDALQEKFSTSNRMPEYRFKGRLSDVHSLVSSVAIKDNPAEGQKKLEEFLKEYADSPLSKPNDSGFGYDIFEAGRKLVDAFADNSEQSLKNFVADRKQRELLDSAEKATGDGRRLIPIVERYRIKDIQPLDEQRKRFDTLTTKFERERERLRVIDPYRDLAEDPTDQRIAEFVSMLTKTKFDTDSEAKELVAAAKAELRRLIRGTIDFRPPVAMPKDTSGGLLYVSAPLGQAQYAPNIVPPDAVPEVFFATARGVLYAFDPETGNLLWAARVGQSQATVPTRVPERVGTPELVLVPTERDGYGLVARVARTGEPQWYQPLEANIAGQPVLVANRVYVPLRDELGTVVEIEASTGNRLSHIRLRQRIGSGAVVQPGTSLFYVAAEARRIFTINAEPFDAEGNRQAVRCTQVLATDHPDLSLKVPPVITGPGGEAKANRYLILAQTDGTQSTKLLAFPIIPAGDFDPAVGPPEVVAQLAGSSAMPGHVVFPPHTDGERVAVVTDAGAFGLFGTNQAGNTDPSIYAIPGASLATDTKNPQPGQVISAEEDTYWAVARGKLIRMRLGVSAKAGLQFTTDTLAQPVGIPVQIPQVNLRRDLAFLVVRSEDSAGLRAITFDPRDGRMKWQRKLGVLPASAPITHGETTTLTDEDGGIYQLPNREIANTTEKTLAIDSTWVVANPVLNAFAPAKMCANKDGSRVWVLIPERGEKDSLRLRIRLISQGKVQPDATVQLPERPVGQPVPAGAGVAFPCADGILYRYEPGAEKLQTGPTWRGEGVGPNEPCYVSTIADDEFLTTDGAKSVTRWRWTNATDAKAVLPPWKLQETISFAPVLVALSANELRLFVAETNGNVRMYDGNNSAGDSLQRWRASKDDPENPIPAGKPTTGFVIGQAGGIAVISYCVENRHIVAVSPGQPKALWVARRLGSANSLGGVAHGSVFLYTDLSGLVTAYDQTSGDQRGKIRPQNSTLLPGTPAIPVGDGKSLFLPLLDGSTVTLPNPSG